MKDQILTHNRVSSTLIKLCAFVSMTSNNAFMAFICCFQDDTMGDFRRMFCSQILEIAKIKTPEMAVMTRFAKISSRENIDLYSI